MRFKADDGSKWEACHVNNQDNIYITRIPEKSELEKWIEVEYRCNPSAIIDGVRDGFNKAIEIAQSHVEEWSHGYLVSGTTPLHLLRILKNFADIK